MAGQQAAIYEAYRQDFAKKNADVIEPALIDIKEVLPLRVQKNCYDVISRSANWYNWFIVILIWPYFLFVAASAERP